jgi:hypothetical protein
VADIELRREMHPRKNFDMLKKVFFLAVISFGVTMDKFKALLITFIYFAICAASS